MKSLYHSESDKFYDFAADNDWILNTKPVYATRTLTQFLGISSGEAVSRYRVLHSVCKYIDDNNLGCEMGFKVDAKLEKIFGTLSTFIIDYNKIPDYLDRHVIGKLVRSGSCPFF